jgi:RNA polymerase subunit RPABC4/transcription elongation factor Spt4
VAPEICPQCGSEVPPNAKACPECGSDERTGWSEEARTAGLDLPDEEFNYEDFAEREFGSAGRAKPRGLSWFWWVVALAVAGAFLAFWLL